MEPPLIVLRQVSNTVSVQNYDKGSKEEAGSHSKRVAGLTRVVNH